MVVDSSSVGACAGGPVPLLAKTGCGQNPLVPLGRAKRRAADADVGLQRSHHRLHPRHAETPLLQVSVSQCGTARSDALFLPWTPLVMMVPS